MCVECFVVIEAGRVLPQAASAPSQGIDTVPYTVHATTTALYNCNHSFQVGVAVCLYNKGHNRCPALP